MSITNSTNSLSEVPSYTRHLTPSYKHSPLDLSKNQIRLAQILAPNIRGPSCSLAIFDRDSCPPYVALSYEWGSKLDRKTIAINGNALFVTKNLYHLLVRVEWQQLVDKSYPMQKGTYLWIDQICIDQSHAAEKNHQVRQMAQIFKRAEGVISWLGESDQSSDIAMDHIVKVADELWPPIPPKFVVGKPLPKGHARRIDEFSSQHTHAFDQVIRLLRRPYWLRLWITQEFILARSFWIICGDRYIDWWDLDKFYQLAVVSDAYPPTRMRQKDDSKVNMLFIHKMFASRNETVLLNPFLFLTFSLHHCEDPRDRIYGTLGLSDIGREIKVDYSRQPQEIFWRAMGHFSCHDQNFPNNRQEAVILALVAKAMGVPWRDLSERFKGGVLKSMLKDVVIIP